MIHACYRGSYAATLAAAGTITLHGALGTGANQVDRFVALTEFGREKFIAGGLPADRIVVKPNLLFPDSGPGTGD